jgi:hypothetical protein
VRNINKRILQKLAVQRMIFVEISTKIGSRCAEGTYGGVGWGGVGCLACTTIFLARSMPSVIAFKNKSTLILRKNFRR